MNIEDVITGCLFCSKEFVIGVPVIFVTAELTSLEKYRLCLCMDCGSKVSKYGQPFASDEDKK